MTNPVNLYAVAGAVSQAFKISRSQIKGPSRNRFVVRARFASAYLMRSMRPDVDLDRIQALLGQRDGSTIRHAAIKGGRLVRSDPEFAALCEEAKAMACSWRVGSPLPGFAGPEAILAATEPEKPPVVKIKRPRPIDRHVERGYQCADDYASPLWYKQNNDNLVAGLTLAHPELLRE